MCGFLPAAAPPASPEGDESPASSGLGLGGPRSRPGVAVEADPVSTARRAARQLLSLKCYWVAPFKAVKHICAIPAFWTMLTVSFRQSC